MTPDAPDITTSHINDSVPEPQGVEEGIALVLRAEDHGDWKPVVDWLARNPAAAGEVADFLAVQGKLRPPAGWAAARSPAGNKLRLAGDAPAPVHKPDSESRPIFTAEKQTGDFRHSV